MKIQVFANDDEVARAGAGFIAAEAHAAVAARGRFVMAVSGGRTPWLMLRLLGDVDMPWPQVIIEQVDERVAPSGHPDRNLTHIKENLFAHTPLKPEQLLAMPVEADDLEAAADEYAAKLREVAGTPPMLDLIHLGLGPDGHTASLVPDDPVLEVMDRDVATSGPYQGRKRMTLTYAALNRARRILWLVTGAEKAPMLARLRDGDPAIPAGRVSREFAMLVTDVQ